MPITITQAGHGQGPGSSGTTATAAYNQAAGRTILVFANQFSAGFDATTPIQDTAGNVWTRITALTVVAGGGNNYYQGVWFCYNCLGNSSNVITVKYTTNSSFRVVNSYDISGVLTASSPIDASALGAFVGNTGSASVSLTTAQAAEAVVTFVGCSSANLTTATQPSGYIEDPSGPLQSYSCGASKVLSSIQSSVTLTWSSGTLPLIASVVSFKGIVSTGVPNSLAMMGCGV